MNQKIQRSDALREMNVKTLPDGSRNVFSLRFVTKSGESVYLPYCYQLGFSEQQRASGLRRRNVQPCTDDGTRLGNPVSVAIDLITEYNRMRVYV